MNEEDRHLWDNNRVRKTEPLSDKSSWCEFCDRELVREGEKCRHCGRRNGKKSKHAKPK